MNVLSLFDGISAGQVALQRAGIKVDNYYASEIDKYAIQVTQKNFPNTIQLGNVFDIDFTKLPRIDIIMGGFPCTNISIAKKDREVNLEGETGKLFNKIVEAINILKPKYFLVENNHSIHQDVKDAVAQALGVKHIMINSALLSAQQRKRCYWTNIPNVTQPEDKKIRLADIIPMPKFTITKNSYF